MFINSESDTSSSNANYRPAFVGYFEQQDRKSQQASSQNQAPDRQPIPVAPPQVPPLAQQQQQQAPANRPSAPVSQFQANARQPFQRSFIDGDFSFVS